MLSSAETVSRYSKTATDKQSSRQIDRETCLLQKDAQQCRDCLRYSKTAADRQTADRETAF
jgi:hypothetical protein